MEALVIIISDPARPEHAAVAAVAPLIAPRLPAGTRVLTVPALDVDLADDVAGATSVVLVAADQPAALLEACAVEAAPHGEYGRSLEPGHLLEIAFANYGARPSMRLVTVPPDASPQDVTAEVLRLLGV